MGTAQQNHILQRHRLVVLPYGLGSKQMFTYMVSQAGNRGNSQVIDSVSTETNMDYLADSPADQMVRSNKVAIRRLDDLLPLPNAAQNSCSSDTVGSIALMKIDVQGFEYQVFAGARQLLSKGVIGA